MSSSLLSRNGTNNVTNNSILPKKLPDSSKFYNWNIYIYSISLNLIASNTILWLDIYMISLMCNWVHGKPNLYMGNTSWNFIVNVWSSLLNQVPRWLRFIELHLLLSNCLKKNEMHIFYLVAISKRKLTLHKSRWSEDKFPW